MGEPKRGTIKARNKEETLEAVKLLWGSLCDKPKAIHKRMTKDAVMAEVDQTLYGPKTEPTLHDWVDEDDFEPWTAYKIHDDPDFVEVDMMSSAVIYRITAWRLQEGQMVGTEAMCSSVFRQGADGDWKCCAHHMARIA